MEPSPVTARGNAGSGEHKPTLIGQSIGGCALEKDGFLPSKGINIAFGLIDINIRAMFKPPAAQKTTAGIKSNEGGSDDACGAFAVDQIRAQDCPEIVHRPDRNIVMPDDFLPCEIRAPEITVPVRPCTLLPDQIMRTRTGWRNTCPRAYVCLRFGLYDKGGETVHRVNKCGSGPPTGPEP